MAVKDENFIKCVEDAWGRKRYHFRCERCGREYSKDHYDYRTSPICNRCYRIEQAISAEARRQTELQAMYDKGFNDGILAAMAERSREEAEWLEDGVE